MVSWRRPSARDNGEYCFRICIWHLHISTKVQVIDATVVDDLDGLPNFLWGLTKIHLHMKVGKLWHGWGWMRMRMNVSFWQADKLWFASIEIRITSDVHSKMLRTDQLEDHLQTSRQVSNSLTLTSTRDLGFKCLVVHVILIFLAQIAL